MDSATALAGSGPAYVYQVRFCCTAMARRRSCLPPRHRTFICSAVLLVSRDTFTCLQMLEAMADGAVNAGLPRDKAQALAAQTLIGAARMVSSLPLEVHRWSPPVASWPIM
jgi:pyrroline-5-carboxylate reductase